MQLLPPQVYAAAKAELHDLVERNEAVIPPDCEDRILGSGSEAGQIVSTWGEFRCAAGSPDLFAAIALALRFHAAIRIHSSLRDEVTISISVARPAVIAEES